MYETIDNEYSDISINTPVDRIFIPSKNVAIVFDIDLLTPIVRNSIIFDCNYESTFFFISQTSPQILPSLKNKKMHITTLLRKNDPQDKIRVGLRCRIAEFIKDYPLSDTVKENAILLKYYPPIQKLNLRAAYRLYPTKKFEIIGKIFYKGNLYKAGRHYKIQNISVTGLGIILPKMVNGKSNPLLNIKVGEEFETELIFMNHKTETFDPPVPIFVKVIRKSATSNQNNGILGTKYIDLDHKTEKQISHFVNDTQLFTIRNMKRT